jgi:uncharacterized protein YdgA (DUF945 family)
VKKILIIVVVVLMAAVAALPYWFGMQAESAYQAMVKEMTENGDLTVTSNNFQRGWLESTADTTFTVTGAPITLTVLHRIGHGPLPVDDNFQLQPVLARIKSDMSISLPGGLTKLPPITGNTDVYLAGNSQTKLSMAPAKQSSPDGGTIEWKGLSGTIETSADFKTSKGEITAPLLQFGSASGSVALNRAKITLDQQKSASGFATGTASLAIDKLIVDGVGGKNSIDGLNLTSKTQEAGGNLNSDFTLQFREASTGDSRQGPGQINIQIRKLDVATLVKFRNELRELRKQKIPAEQMNMTTLGKTLELLGQLAKKSPELEITKLTFKTTDGEVSGKAKFVLDGSQLDVSGNPMLMLRALSGDGELSLPDSLVRMLASSDVKRDIEALKASGKLKKEEIAKLSPKRIEMITQQALRELPQYRDSVITRLKLVPDGPNYKIVGVLKNGQVMVNNEPIQLP